MVHQAEIDSKLKVTRKSFDEISDVELLKSDVMFIRLPNMGDDLKSPLSETEFQGKTLHNICKIILYTSTKLKESSTLLIMGESAVLPYVASFLNNEFHFHNWIAIRLSNDSIEGKFLKNEHIGLLVYTKKDRDLKHSTVRIGYEYCKYCNKTTKDYGGKKHLYHWYGTLISDVWRDIVISKYDEFPDEIINRVKDLFSIHQNKNMLVTSLWNLSKKQYQNKDDKIPESTFPSTERSHSKHLGKIKNNNLKLGDAIEELVKIKDDSVDMIFVDPPYNLRKKYHGYSDRLQADEYFRWCNNWLSELIRVLRPGGSLFVVNIPQSSIQFFLYLKQKLHFQNWIVWDALSVPVNFIMPAHYSILYFTKGPKPNTLNYSTNSGKKQAERDEILKPLDFGFCIRSTCITKRQNNKIDTTRQLTDLWTDIHRVKHNSLREDHPTILPVKLLKRLILLSTKEDDLVLDCFNGVGTTTLVAAQLDRNYFGIEKNPNYYQVSANRHEMLKKGIDPFEKKKTIPKAKNSTLARVKIQNYEVPKKALQLEVKEMSLKLGRSPTRDDVIKLSKYPIEYFDKYFRNWSEVVAATRTTGMSEMKST